jgi:predicted 3-demethylubiquinone-9 3-methyltransferase (glyoxalase superfamily)
MCAMGKSPRITPFLWFNSNAEEAADFYVSVFKNSRRLDVLRVPADTAVVPKGKALTASFELDGQKFTALARRSSSPRQCRLWCAANRRRKWMNIGRS